MARNRERYNARMKEYMKRRYHERRAAILDRMGGACVICGSVEDLQIDHRDHTQKSFAVGKLWNLAPEKLGVELAKCRLMCAPCHRIKSAIERGHTPKKWRE